MRGERQVSRQQHTPGRCLWSAGPPGQRTAAAAASAAGQPGLLQPPWPAAAPWPASHAAVPPAHHRLVAVSQSVRQSSNQSASQPASQLASQSMNSPTNSAINLPLMNSHPTDLADAVQSFCKVMSLQSVYKDKAKSPVVSMIRP